MHLYTYINILMHTYTYICVYINVYVCMNRYMRIDTCMFNGYFFLMGAGVGISFWCILKLCEWNELFLGNFWDPPNLSSCCDNNHTYVKHVSFKNIILGRHKIMKNPLRIHAKSLSDALAPSKNKCLRRWYPATVRGSRIYSWSAHCLPDFCQKGWSKGFCRLQQTCTPTGDDPKYVTTIPDVHIWTTRSL